MNHVDYLKRLGLQGGRLVWRVLMILGPVVGAALWQVVRAGASAYAEQEERNPIISSRLEAVDALNEGKIGAAEMAYYEEVYGD